jgi:hypothetical protein
VYVCALFYYHPAYIFAFFLISFHIYYLQQTQSIIKSFKVEEGMHRPEYQIIRVDAKFCSTFFFCQMIFVSHFHGIYNRIIHKYQPNIYKARMLTIFCFLVVYSAF